MTCVVASTGLAGQQCVGLAESVPLVEDHDIRCCQECANCPRWNSESTAAACQVLPPRLDIVHHAQIPHMATGCKVNVQDKTTHTVLMVTVCLLQQAGSHQGPIRASICQWHVEQKIDRSLMMTCICRLGHFARTCSTDLLAAEDTVQASDLGSSQLLLCRQPPTLMEVIYEVPALIDIVNAAQAGGPLLAACWSSRELLGSRSRACPAFASLSVNSGLDCKA